MADKVAKTAGDFGIHRPRKIVEFMDMNLTLTHFETGESSFGPYNYIDIVVENTGEIVHFVTSNKYLMSFIDAIGDTVNCPVAFRIEKLGKAYIVVDWK